MIVAILFSTLLIFILVPEIQYGPPTPYTNVSYSKFHEYMSDTESSLLVAPKL